MQKGAFDSAIAGIKGEKAANDPVLVRQQKSCESFNF